MGGKSYVLRQATLTLDQIARLQSLYQPNQSYELMHQHKLVLVFRDSRDLTGGITWYKGSGYRMLVSNLPDINVLKLMPLNNIYVFDPEVHKPIMIEKLTLRKYHYYFVADFLSNPNALSHIPIGKCIRGSKRKATGDEVLPTPSLTPFNDGELRLITDSANGVEELFSQNDLDELAALGWEDEYDEEEIDEILLRLIAEDSENHEL